MTDTKISSDLLRGHTDTMILRLLREADCYGYEIVKLIAKCSGGLRQTVISNGTGAMNLRADGVSILGLLKRVSPRTPTTKAIGSTQSACSITYSKEL